MLTTIPRMSNVFFPPEPVSEAAELLEEVEATKEVRRAINAWLYA